VRRAAKTRARIAQWATEVVDLGRTQGLSAASALVRIPFPPRLLAALRLLAPLPVAVAASASASASASAAPPLALRQAPAADAAFFVARGQEPRGAAPSGGLRFPPNVTRASRHRTHVGVQLWSSISYYTHCGGISYYTQMSESNYARENVRCTANEVGTGRSCRARPNGTDRG
jgi:hypothetical protein